MTQVYQSMLRHNPCRSVRDFEKRK